MPRCAAFLLLLAAACGGPRVQTQPSQRTIFVSEEGVMTTTVADGVWLDTLPGTPMATMRALERAYTALGVEVTLVDPVKGHIGNPRFAVQQRLMGEAMSRYVTCGQTMTGSRADGDRITLALVSAVRSVPGGSAVETRLTGWAQDIRTGNSGVTTPCTSTGLLEGKLHDAVHPDDRR